VTLGLAEGLGVGSHSSDLIQRALHEHFRQLLELPMLVQHCLHVLGAFYLVVGLLFICVNQSVNHHFNVRIEFGRLFRYF